MVEYEDEFGRMRTARKSEVPRHLVKRDDDIPTQSEEEECVPFLSYLILHPLTLNDPLALDFVT